MEPCDEDPHNSLFQIKSNQIKCDDDLHLENDVFPQKFKYKILKRRKIDSQNFECELRIALNDYDDVKEWLKLFKGNTNTEWLLRQSTTCEENVLNQLYVCQNSSYGKKRKHDDDEDSKSDFNCKAAISVKIKKGGKRTYYQDDYVKKGYKGVMRICFIHTHLIDKAEVLNMARQSGETKKAFIGYFTEGMSPSEAIKYHEEVLLLEGHEDLGNSRKNPPEHWVYSLYEEWTKQIENRLQLESQLTRASVFWRLQNRATQPRSDYDSKSKNIVKLCKIGEDINGMQVPADLHVSDEDDDDSDSENQYDSYDEDSTPQVSSNYVSVSSTSHQSTVSSAPLKLNIPSNINITRGCTLQVIKKKIGSNNSPSANVPPLFVRIGKGSNNGQGNSVQIITSHENSKNSAVKFLTVSADSRKYTDVELGKTLPVKNIPKINFAPGKTFLVARNSKELQETPGRVAICGNISKISTVHFIKSDNKNNLKTINLKPVYVRIKKGPTSKDESPLVKSHEAKKEAETVLQQITRFQNSDEKDDIIPSSKCKQTFHRNKVANCRSDVPDESLKPVLKKGVQNFFHSPLSEKMFGNGNVLKDVQNQGIKDLQNCSKHDLEILSKKIIQLSPGQKIITVTKDSILACLSNASIDKTSKKNDDQHESNHFVDSEREFYDCDKQSKSLENINNTDRLTASSTNCSFDNSKASNLVSTNFCDIAQAFSSSSQSGSVQSIKNPISSVVRDIGVSRPVLFDNIDSIHKFPQHDSEVTSSSTLCHGNLFSECNQNSTFQNSKSLEGVPIQGCPFPLPEDYYRTLLTENSSCCIGNQNGGDCQIFPLPFSKSLYNSIENNSGYQNKTDDQSYPLLMPETFCSSSDPPNVTEDSGNNSISSDLSFSMHDPDFSDDCDDINSSQLPADLDMNNEDSLQQIFPDLSKLEDDLNNFNYASTHQVGLCSNQASASSHLSLINTCTNCLPELQVDPVSLFDSSEDNILTFPDNLKGNLEDIDILKNILKCNRFESSELEDFPQTPENFNQIDVLEKWDFEMCRLRSLLEQNSHDKKLMREANQFLERIRESVVTPSELAILFSSSCNLMSKQKKN